MSTGLFTQAQAVVVNDIVQTNVDFEWSEISGTGSDPYKLKALSPIDKTRLVAFIYPDGSSYIYAPGKNPADREISLSDLAEIC